MIRKITRIFLWFIAIFLLLIGILFVLIQTDSVQTWLAHRATAYLSDQLKTKVSVGKVSISFVEKISLKNLYIEDLHHDTLLYAEEMLINIKDLSTSKHNMELSMLKLDHAKFFLTRYKGEDHDNIQFISDYFSSKDTSKSTSPWKIKLNDIRFEDVNFRHIVEDHEVRSDKVDFAHLDVKNIFGDLKNISFINDSVFVTIDGLRFKDKSGFQLDELSTNAKVSPKEMRMNQLVIRTPKTNLHTDLTFNFDSLSAFDDFEDSVNFNSGFKHSAVSLDDIAFFAPGLKGLSRTVTLDGNFKGTVSRFKGKNVTIEYGEHSYFKGNVAMTGLPDINETYMDILAEDVRINKKDVETIPVTPYENHEHIVVPENLAAIGNIDFKGKFTGFPSDFVAFGNITTDIGFISCDMNLKLDRQKNTSVYSGHLSTNNFDTGKLLSSNDLGKITMNVDISGNGMQSETADATMKGTIESLEFRKYTYHSINVNGEISKKLFTGALSIHEPNVDLDFSGTVNFRQSIPQYDFTADIGRAHLDTLNLFRSSGEKEVKTKIITHLSGNKLDNLEGTVELQNTDFRFDNMMYHVNSFLLSAVNTNGNRSFSIRSDNMDADFTGRFELAKLGDAFRQIMPTYLPAVLVPGKYVTTNQDFSFNIRLKNMDVVTENFLPSWTFDPNTNINGKFNSTTNTILLNIESPLVRYKNFTFTDAKLNTSTDKQKMKLTISTEQLFYSDSASIMALKLHAEADNNVVAFSIQTADSSVYSNRANLTGDLRFASSNKFRMHFNESSIILQNEKWLMNSGNTIDFDSSSISVTDFSFSKQKELIGIQGVISKNPNDHLQVSFTDFNLQNLNPLLKSSKITTGGILTGNATVSDLYHKTKLESDLSILQLQFNGDTLGDATFGTTFDDDKKDITVKAFIQNANVKSITIDGDYHTDIENNNLDFKIGLNNFYLTTVGKYIDDVVSELNGRVSADLILTGNFSHPVLSGKLSLNRVRCKVNYLNTYYSFTNDITVGENYFDLKDFKIYDDKSESAVANGRITHQFFKDFNFDVHLQAKKFQCLNTVASQNSIYYGNANASGSAYFSGPLKNMNMQIQFKSEKGTQISIPLSSSSELSQSNFITFLDKGKFTGLSTLTNSINLSGIRLDMNLEMTPDAEIQIIFDEKIGDKITGVGSGNLRLEITPDASFNMYGNYEIESGSYLFTLQNIINKKFAISRGSTISWSGNPYDADINLNAIYTTKTSTLYKLLPDSSLRTSLYVDCELDLSNKLMNPTIHYSINVRGVDASTESQIHSLLNSEAEVSKQMFGLLVLNQFIPTSGTSQAAGRIDAAAGAGANGWEFLSDQVNNWLSQISPDVNIGVNYKARDIYSKEEVQLMFSKSLDNDRLLLEGNVGVIGTAASDQSTSNIVGDFNAEYKISSDGRFRIKAYNKSNTSSYIFNYSPYTQGLGVFYREEFDTFHQLLQRYRLAKRKETQKQPSSMNQN